MASIEPTPVNSAARVDGLQYRPKGTRKGLVLLRRLTTRILAALVVILGVVTITFLLSRVFTANPVNLFVPADASAQTRAEVQQSMGLANPIPIQYVHFIAGLMHGDLGTSYETGQPVTADLLSRLPATLELGTYAVLVGLFAAIVGGVIAAVRRGKIVDHVVRALSVSSVSAPRFWIGLMFLWVFFVILKVSPGPAGRLPVGVNPPPTITGFYVIDSLLSGNWSLAWTSMQQLALPVLCLATGVFGPVAGVVRSEMIKALDSQYIRTAIAMGIGMTRIRFVYALKNGLLPVVTVLAGVIGYTMSGAVLIEGIFGWPGVGNYALVAIQKSDYPAIQGFVIYAAILYVIIIALLEFAYSVIDPRIRR